MRTPNLAMPNYLAAPKGEERRRSTAVLSHCTLQPRRDWLARFGEVGEVGTPGQRKRATDEVKHDRLRKHFRRPSSVLPIRGSQRTPDDPPPGDPGRWCARPGIETNDTDGLKASLATPHAGRQPAHHGGQAA